MSLAILVPVLGRPERVKPLLDSIAATTPEPHRVLFLLDLHDDEEFQAVLATGADFISPGGNYAEKINLGVTLTQESLIFLGADDLEFQPGWLEAARVAIDQGAQVVGVNDLIRRRRRPQHATHFLVTRNYAEQPTIDDEPGPLHEGYSHWCIDDELIATARKRSVYAYAEDSHVKHLHPFAGLAADDETYRKGRARMRLDLRLFARRQPLWT